MGKGKTLERKLSPIVCCFRAFGESFLLQNQKGWLCLTHVLLLLLAIALTITVWIVVSLVVFPKLSEFKAILKEKNTDDTKQGMCHHLTCVCVE